MGDASAPQRRKPRFRERNAIAPAVEVSRPRALPVTAPPALSRPLVQKRRTPVALPALTLEQALYLGLVLGGFALRLWDVGSRAMHGDEAVHAWLAWNLFKGAGYQYDPVYHGPLQFPLTALSYFLFGVSNTSGRLLAVLCGSALVGMPYFLRKELGRPAALMAAAFIAISPSFVYVARLERDDALTSLFAMTMVIGIFGFLRTRESKFVYLAVTSAALSLTAMENTYITLFVFVSFLTIAMVSETLAATSFGDTLSRLWRLTGSAGLVRSQFLAGIALVLVILLLLTVLTGWYPPVPIALALLLVALVHRQAFMQSRESSEARIQGAFRSIGDQTWLNSVTIALALLFLLYSTFGTNLRGVWDAAQPIFASGAACGQAHEAPLGLNPCRKDILGGLFYWLAQHKVARGGQPWFYYPFLFSLYEQVAVVFGLGGMAWFLRRPTLFTTFLTYWAVLMFGVYSWAGEKFPWLTIHPLLPFLLIGAMFAVDLVRRPGWTRYAALVAAAILGAVEIHSTVQSSFVNSANPVEMMVYVQSSPDTPRIAQQVLTLSNKATNDASMHVTIDSDDTWPFAWYLRDMPNAAYPGYPQLLKPPFSTNPVILVDENHQADLAPQLKGYSGKPYVLRWWFPEDYKSLSWKGFLTDARTPGYWSVIGQWLVDRRPFGPPGSNQLYVYVKKGFVSPY